MATLSGLVFAVVVSLIYPNGEVKTYNLGDTPNPQECYVDVQQFNATLSVAKLVDYACEKAYKL